MSIEAMKQALEALDSDNPDIQLRAATALRAAIERAKKPVEQCPECERNKFRAAMWRAEAYKQAGHDKIERPQQTEGEGPSMKRELYDFTIPPDTPKDVYTTMYYFPHDRGSSRGLYPTAPAFREPPCMAAHYDKDGNLLFTRFIFKDGTYRDAV